MPSSRINLAARLVPIRIPSSKAALYFARETDRL
jgi:hypothetical protein